MNPTAFSCLVRAGSSVACVFASAIAIVSLLALVAGAQAAATTSTFTPTTAGTYAWTTGGNWSGGVPVSATDATVAFFPDVTTALTGAVTINTDPATLTLNTLTLNGLTAATAAANSIGTAGNTWTFDGTTPTLNLNGKSGATSLSYTLKPNLTLNQNLTFAGIGLNGGLTISGVISGLNTGITNNSKPSTITLNGSVVNTFTGGVTLYGGMVGAAGGTLALPGALAEDFTNLAASPNNNLIDSGNVLTLAGGRISLVNKYNTASSQTFASTTLSANTCSVVTLAVVGSGSMTVALQAITRNPGSTLVFSAAPNASTLLAPTAIANEASGILGPWFFAGNAAYACNNGSGQIVAYAGATVAAATAGSTLSEIANKDVNYSFAGINGTTYTLGGNITGNTLTFLTAASGASYTVANNGNSITLNGINAIGSGSTATRTISGAGNLVIGANKELVINVFRPLTISCPIVDWNGAGAGASRLTYSSAQAADSGYALKFTGTAANTYSGLTSVAGGSLTLQKTAGVNAIAGDVIVSSGALIWGANNQIADTANLTFTGTGKVSGTPTETVASVTVNGNNGIFGFAGSTAFTITGALAITGDNGAAATSYGLAGTAAMTVGSLSLDNAFYYVGTASGDTATFNLNGDLTGANTSSLNTSATAPKFVLKGTGIHNHNFNITSGATTISPPISQTTSTTAALTKTGAGTLTLTGLNTYTGPTTVQNGILSITQNTAIQSTGDVKIYTGSTLNLNYSGTDNIRSLYIDGVGQVTGVWGSAASGTANQSSLFTGSGTLTVGTLGSTLTYSISGTVTLNGAGLAGVTVSDGTRSATTAGDGTYTISSVPDAATYTVTASLSGYTFTPSSASVAVKGVNVIANNYTATVSAGPTITLADTLGAVSTIYGTASVTPTSFHVSGSALTGNLTVTPPSGYEVSLSSSSGYTTSQSITASGTLASTQVYVRLAATTGVNGGAGYAGNITVSGGGATSKTIATVSSTVSPAALTITGLTGTNKTYDGTTSASFTGTAAYSGLQNSESFTVTGTPSAAFTSAAVGNGKTINVSGYTAPSANYSLTQPSLTANISPKALTAQGTLAGGGKTYDGLTAVTPTGAAALQSTETAGTGTTSDGKPYGVDAVSLTGTASYAFNTKDVTTATTITGSGLSLTGTGNGNYTLTAPTLSAAITTKALTMSGLSVPASKVYDGGITASVSGTPTLQTAEATGSGTTGDGKPYTGDTVSITGTATGTYDSKDVATASSVSFGGLSLTGGQATNYSLTMQSPASATITKANQTISFTSLVAKAVGDPTFDLTATASSGLSVTYVSSAPGVASASGSTVTLVAAGVTTLTASQAGDGNFNAATPVPQSLTVMATAFAGKYRPWIAAYTNLTGADTNPDADPDHDGVTNMMEYANGTNPDNGSSGTGVMAYAGANVTAHGQPIPVDLSPGNGVGGVDYRAVFGRRKDYADSGLTYTMQFSADNSNWVSSNNNVQVLTTGDSVDGTMDAVSVTYPLFIPVTGGYQKPTFFRVAVSAN